MVAAFDALPLRDVPRRPRIGLVGEILVKFHPDANNNAVDVIEDEGCEAVLPGLLEFFGQMLYTGDWKWEHLGIGEKSRHAKKIGLWLIEQYQAPANRRWPAAAASSPSRHVSTRMAQRAQNVVSLGTTAGEGWLLTAEMMELIESGTPNIICAQPFACLPNHVVGKGMFRELRRLYPHANITSIDYDPGASEVNQLNRIKLVVSTAQRTSSASGHLGRWDEDDENYLLAGRSSPPSVRRRPSRPLGQPGTTTSSPRARSPRGRSRGMRGCASWPRPSSRDRIGRPSPHLTTGCR